MNQGLAHFDGFFQSEIHNLSREPVVRLLSLGEMS
jgi:hypothetical protein